MKAFDRMRLKDVMNKLDRRSIKETVRELNTNHTTPYEQN